MNIDNNSKCKVVSKYFIGNTVMDESLTDFKEKKSFQGPKNIKSIPKPRAKTKVKIKGQKDIRTALKAKKNELLEYSKDFDNVCKKSGIDVDSEQLQLAIALSKSLQTSEASETATTSQPLNTQQRTGLIRTTLKEYGFKVPEIKPNGNRKVKKRRKSYKLLLTTEEQKQQIVSDRYTQLLFELNNSKERSTSGDYKSSSLILYNMATNVCYDDIKEDDVFYVEDLIEKSPNNMGCLLKNWSDIPGRPTSPKQDKSEIIFSEIECSQDEVDFVLSGSLKYSKDFLKKKHLHARKSISSTNEEVIDLQSEEIDLVKSDSTSSAVIAVDDCMNDTVCKDTSVEVVAVPDKLLLTVTQPVRSLSPDLFDDDDDDADDIVEIAEESPIKLADNVTKEVSTVMDLTECVNVISQNSVSSYYKTIKQASQFSQEVNITKRKSNDFMEITECVGVASQVIQEHIDLTVPGTNDVVQRSSITVGQINLEKFDHMDLTQSSNSNDSLPFVHISGKERIPERSIDATIILNENEYQESNLIADIKENLSTNELNADNDEYKNVTTQFKQISDEVIKRYSPVHKEASIINLDETTEDNKVDDEIDLTQTSKSNDFDGGSPLKDTAQCTNITNHEVDKTEDSINLTQTMQLNERNIEGPAADIDLCVNNSSLGKKDDVSVDYDEALENMNCYVDYAQDSNYNDDNNTIMECNMSNEVVPANNSKNTEVIELNKSESNSPSKNVEHNFDIGGLSIINGLQSFNRESRSSLNVPNGSVMSESLPMVDIKGKEPPKTAEFLNPIVDNISDRFSATNRPNSTTKTPTKESGVKIAVTPDQSEYIVKTDNVTPMVDYAAMTSPERNRELDKYGLKPFKRKRAIQLLTHLYNQTHPFVESAQEQTSPFKRRKLSLSQPSTSNSLRKSPKKVPKPRNGSKSPRKVLEDCGSLNEAEKENCMFMVTSEVPALREIDCGPDDWVFQKREKAKLHTCRLPLHIALHNYVSCRRLLQEAILRYEPVNIDVIHKELVASGHRYDPKDLLKFMDKKCITVKTVENANNKNRY